MNAVLQRFSDNLPTMPRATDNFNCGLPFTPLSIAPRFRYIQHNRSNRITYITFDIDHEWAAIAANDAHLPQPTISVLNPDNGKGHLMYELKSPVTISDKHIKPHLYASAIEHAYTHRLGADMSYVGFTTKNPLCNHWRVLSRDYRYELGELADWVTLPKIWRRKKIDNQYAELGRHCQLFVDAKTYAYREWRRCANENIFYSSIFKFCELRNSQFSEELPFSEVNGVVRSIVRWVWPKFSNAGFREVQARRGRKSAKVRRNVTEAKIIRAIEQIRIDGLTPTQSAVSRATGISQNNLSQNYRHHFQ